MSILQIQTLSFSKALTGPSPTQLFLHTKPSHPSLYTQPITPKTTTIRMGGGPRTYPGGVSKWQWKRMQAKKAKQLLKARLSRERQMYEMRKRAELKAAVSELERPWEVVERAPNLFSINADEQLKVLADRFQRPGGFDLWTERDGPQLFQTVHELPSARFFPKGVVHSIKPYLRNGGVDLDESNGAEEGENLSDSESLELSGVSGRNEKRNNGKLRKNGNVKRFEDVGSNGSGGTHIGLDRKQSGKGPIMRGGHRRNSRGNGSMRLRESQSDVYDMSLQHDGSYGFRRKNGQNDFNSGTNGGVEV
ncbi:putative dead-box atp-dependent rna helicase 33 [Fagus crenata]